MVDIEVPAGGNEDLRRLDEEHKKNPAEPLWQLLARLGWVPPATAESFRARIHELEGRHAIVADLAVGQKILPEPAGLEILQLEQAGDFITMILEDGSRRRFHRMDTVAVL